MLLLTTEELAVQGVAVPVSKPGLPSSCVPPSEELTAQLNEADPATPAVSVAVTVTVLDPAVAGVPEMSPDAALMESPAGRPAAL